MDLQTPVKDAGLVFRLKSQALTRLNIFTLEDLLFHLPFRYEDYTNAVAIKDLKIGKQSVIKGTVIDIKNEFTRKSFVLQKATITDGTREVICTWFNQTYITKIIHPGDSLGLVGKLDFFGKKPTFQVKEYEVLNNGGGLHTTGFVPIYNETKGLSSKWIRNRIYDFLKNNKNLITEFLPLEELTRLHFTSLYDSFFSCHFPKSLDEARIAHDRLAFDELLLAHLAAMKRRSEWEKQNKGIPFDVEKFEIQSSSFVSSLPFTLTEGQQKAYLEIKNDLQKETPMNRLLEGDVGSGKTVVAAIAMHLAYLNGYQSVLMAPTEILATQHFKTLETFLKPMGMEIALFTGNKKTHKNEKFDIAVGTHALIQKSLDFEKLGLVVIDEQQRFGVEQRSLLREKGKNPHFLTMTATPIPRTILLAVYKDLDLSLLNEVPMGRKEIKTWLVPNSKRADGYIWVKKQIIESKYHDQAFIVCPFIDESESMDTVKAAKSEFERLQKEDLKGLKLGLLHGKMKTKEKEEVLKEFKEKKIHVLVATPVVEVGIDIPDATIMIIEAAERFGLAQLHQLRGRVGRGDKQSYCLLFTESQTEIVQTRLKYMETSHSGFELAELDLKLRGGGDLFGTRQHGVAGLKVADFRNFELVEKAKIEAEHLYPQLSQEKKLLQKVESITLKLINPD
ncbi:MAG: ATP-dependent DNA helicase RecG [Candidatus Levybacteria bacterium]|nr:ATP-dependent DNA helicase RecG [Candidatus Levybacteria bacterium]